MDYSPTILRFATAFGLSSRMRFDLTISEFTREMHAGKPLLVYDADTWRPYCHVLDFAELIDLVLRAEKEKVSLQIFNAGGRCTNATKRQIIEKQGRFLSTGKGMYISPSTMALDPRNL